MKRIWIAIILAALMVVCGFILFSSRSALPIDNGVASHIVFNIYPQDTPTFTVTDDTRVEEIVAAINKLSVENSDSRPEHMSDYYHSLVLHCIDSNDIWIELDENLISIDNDCFIADTKPLRDLLEKTYYDIQNWNIE